jgi:hypothetical protein
MSEVHNYLKEFKDLRGLDLRASELTRDMTISQYTGQTVSGAASATAAKNVMLRQNGALNKRPGFSIKAVDAVGYGTEIFHNVNLTTGAISEEIVSVGAGLSKLISSTMTITYNGIGAANYSIFSDGSQIQFYLYVDGNTLLNTALGIGTEGSPITITQLVAAINTVSNFVAVGTSSSPAAFLEVSDNTALSATPLSLTYYTWSTISLPTGYKNPITHTQSTPFYNYYADRTNLTHENASLSEVNNVIYVSTGLDELHKYDGTRIYRAGLPQGILPVLSVIAGGTRANGLCNYKVTYEYTDAKSNYIQSAISPSAAITISGTNSVGVQYTNLRQTYSSPPSSAANYYGYDTDSSNLKINIYRTVSGAAATSTYYLVAQIVNDGTNDTTIYTDSKTDAQLGAAYVDPIKVMGLPPKCKYSDVWRNMLILGGCPTAVNTVSYADAGGEGNESFPISNAFDVDTKITGLRSLDNTLGVFRERAIDGVTGDLYVDSLQVDHISRDGIGCAANASIKEINGALYFLSLRGIYRISIQNGLEFIGLPISPVWQTGNPYSFLQATALNWNDKFLYIVNMPVLSSDASFSSDTLSNSYAYDYIRNAWFPFSYFNFMGGYCQKSDGTLWLNSRRQNEVAIVKIKTTGTQYDYSDHIHAIDSYYYSHWETMDQPSLWKKFLRIKLHSYDISINDFECDTFSLNIITQNDYQDSNLTDWTLSFSSGNAGWGFDPWGDFTWGEVRLSQIRTKIASKKAKSMRLGFLNPTIHENFLLSGWETEVTVPYKPTAVSA